MGNNDLGDFLRARRAGLTPEEIGLPVEFDAWEELSRSTDSAEGGVTVA
jgi:hypothetical protein